MSIFSTILQKLGIQKPAAPAQAAPAADKPMTFTPTANFKPNAPATPAQAAAAQSAQAAAKPAAMPMVDVVSKLNNLSGEKSGLDWKVSIVDLLKLLDIDSSLQARKELANELGCPANLIGGDYSQMNVWLHKTVLQKVADNGGNIPADLLKKA